MGIVINNEGIKTMLERFLLASPTRGQVSDFVVGENQTSVFNVASTDVDNRVQFDASEGEIKNIEAVGSGGSSFDESKLEIVVRCVVLDTQANGADLDATALLNGSGSVIGLADHLDITKTVNKKVIHLWKIKLRTDVEL